MNSFDRAREALNAMFSDKSVPISQTREWLTDLRDEIEICLDALPEDE